MPEFEPLKVGTKVLIHERNRGTIVGYGGYQREGFLHWCYLVFLEEGAYTEGRDFFIGVIVADASNITRREG